MFFLRCIFWLAVMYAAMANGAGALQEPGGAEAAIASTTSATAAALARASDWCAGRPALCIRDAASLTALVESVGASSRTEDALAETPRRRAPLPVPDPRRRGEHAGLTGSN